MRTVRIQWRHKSQDSVDRVASNAGKQRTAMHTIRNHANYGATAAAVTVWVNNNSEKLCGWARQFTNIVCLVAYQFRAKGHHYLESYRDSYARLWGKIKGVTEDFGIGWDIIALHAIPPIVLDKFWEHAYSLSRCAPSMAIRYNIPSAGTAALSTIHTGWADIDNIYAVQTEIRDMRALYYEQADLVNRWRFSVNASLYGQQSVR